jgi:hypothetical protein
MIDRAMVCKGAVVEFGALAPQPRKYLRVAYFG